MFNPSHAHTSIEPLEARIAPASIINPNTILYTDVDGDRVQLTVSKAIFLNTALANKILTFCDSTGNTISNAVAQTGTAAGTPEQLMVIDFTALNPLAVQGINISVKVLPSLGSTGDGKVNVGFIKAANVTVSPKAGFVFGQNIDLGTVTIQGDLGAIACGDNLSTTALRLLDVQSFGELNDAEISSIGNSGGTIVTLDSTESVPQSYVLGPIGTMHVAHDITGADLSVLGYQFGKIGSLTIGGNLETDSFDAARGIAAGNGSGGEIYFMGSLGKVAIGDGIVGGSGTSSASFVGESTLQTSISSLVVGGSITGGEGQLSASIQTGVFGSGSISQNLLGGAGSESGFISAVQISSLKIMGSIEGGTSDTNGDASSSGEVFASSSISSLDVGGDLLGGNGATSGAILAAQLGRVIIHGSLTGAGDSSSGATSGLIDAEIGGIGYAAIGDGITGGGGSSSGELVSAGELTKGFVNGDITGGAGAQSGLISVQIAGSLAVHGNIVGGAGASSGWVGSQEFDSISVSGGLGGGAGNQSGEISFAGGALLQGTIGGNIVGGDGLNSGSVTGSAIGTLTVKGSIFGGDAGSDAVPVMGSTPAVAAVAGHSGSVIVTGLSGIGSLTVDGSVVGGADNSGTLNGSESGEISSAGFIQSLTIKGNIVGEGGLKSGYVTATSIAALKVGGSVAGGSGDSSGNISLSDTLGINTFVGITGTAGSALIAGSVIGGGGVGSGQISAATVESLAIQGGVIGGAGKTSGGVVATGTIESMSISGDLIGGDGTDSGRILATDISSLSVTDISFTSGDANSLGGSIRASDAITTLNVTGEILGSATHQVVISALNKISTVTVGGDSSFADILAGYNTDSSISVDGTGVNGIAQIASVHFDGNITGVNVVAGASAGADGKFGTADDAALPVPMGSSAFSQINNIVVGKSVLNSGGAGASFGFVAAQVGPNGSGTGSVMISGNTVSLTDGPHNDSPPILLTSNGTVGGTPSDTSIFETP